MFLKSFSKKSDKRSCAEELRLDLRGWLLFDDGRRYAQRCSEYRDFWTYVRCRLFCKTFLCEIINGTLRIGWH